MAKPNLRELEDLVGHPLPNAIDQVSVARALIASKSAEIVAITLGGDGALIISQTEVWQSAIPPVTARSVVGAGDSFLGGATLAFAQSRSLDVVLAYGVAAGTSAVLSPGSELSQAHDVERLFCRCVQSDRSSLTKCKGRRFLSGEME